MLKVTDAAGAHLAELLKEQDVPENVAARLINDQGQGLALAPDSERPGDTTVQHEGRTILLLDAQVSELLSEETLEFEDSKLSLKRPK